MNKYEAVLEEFIADNNITTDNVDHKLKEIGFVSFFNFFTSKCCKKIDFFPEVEKTKNKPTSALTYLSKYASENLISNFETLTLNSLYLGVIVNGHLKFNFENYDYFLKEIYQLRKTIRSKIKLNSLTKDDTDKNLLLLKCYLIKAYINTIYGMLDNSESIILTNVESPREYVTETVKLVMLNISSILLNNHISIYYIDTDEFFISELDSDFAEKISMDYENINKSLIDTNISEIFIESQNEHAYFFSKKNFMRFDKNTCTIKGKVKLVNNEHVLNDNKSFFGNNFKEIFPEYAICGYNK